MKRFLISTVLVAAGISAFSNAALAGDDETPLGDATQAWLDLQTSGQHASPAERPMDGEVAQRVYERYLQSFTHPIPEQFPRESFVGEAQ